MKETIIKIVTIILSLVLGYMICQILLVPKNEAVNSLKKNIARVKSQVAGIIGSGTSTKLGAAEEKKLEKELSVLKEKIPTEKDIPRVIDQIVAQAGKGITVEYDLIQLRDIVVENNYKRLSIDLKFATTFSSFDTYLSQLKKLPTAIRIDNLNIQKSVVNPERVSVQMVVSVFVLPEEKRAKPSGKVKEYAGSKVDPFLAKKSAPAAAAVVITRVVTPEVIKLQGIFTVNKERVALINDKVVTKGSTVGRYTVVSIEENHVDLQRGKTIMTLKIGF